MLKYFFKSISTSYINILVSGLAIFIILPTVIDIVGIDIYGEWALIFIFSGLVGFTDFGMSKSLVVLFNNFKSQSKRSQFLVLTFVFSFFLFLITITIFFILIHFDIILKHLNFYQKYNLIFFGFLILLINMLTSILRGLLEYDLKVHIINFGYMIQTITQYLFLYFIVKNSSNINLMYASTLTSFFIVFFFHLAFSYKYLYFNTFKLDRKNIKIYFKNVSGFTLLTISTSLNQPVSRILVSVFSLNNYGYFDIMLKFLLIFNSLVNSLSTPVFSFLSKGINKKRKKIVESMFYISLLIYLVGIILYYFLGDYFWFYYLGKNYFYNFYHILLWGLILYCSIGVTEPLTRFFWSQGNSLYTAKIRLIILPLMLIILLFFKSNINLSILIFSFSFPYFIVSFLSIIYYKMKY